MSDLNFINTNSTEIYNEIITELENGVAEPLYPGDERRIFAEALVPLFVAMYSAVNDAARQKMLRYARGEVLDALGERSGVLRQEPVPAETTLRFSITEAINQNIIIPAGTRVTGDYVRYFSTQTSVVLMAGALSVEVEATAENGGVDYNDIPAGTLNVIVDLIPYVDSVENITATAGGSDQEDDETYRERIRIAPAKLSVAGPVTAYKYWAMSADPKIADAVIESPEPGTVLITPILYGGDIPDATILDKVLEVCSADDVRPLTDLVQVQAPTVQNYDVNIKYYTTAANESKVVAMVEGTDGAIARYNYWQGSALDRDINPDYLRKLILAPDWEDDLVGATRVEVISPVYTELNATTVGKFSGNLTVTHEVKEG